MIKYLIATAYYKYSFNQIYLFPDLSCDERRVYNDHVKVCMVFWGNILGLVEVVEYEARVFVELLIIL